MNQLIIIGAGPMGLYGAFCAGMRGISGLILESSYTYGGQVSALYAEKRIYDIPGFYNTKGIDFINNLYEQYERYKDMMPLKLNTKVLEIIEKDDHFIVNTNNGTYYTKKLLIANGGGTFTPKKLDVDGYFDQNNVLYHVENINKFKDEKIAILGGGDSAADWALELSNIAKSVSLIHRRDNFRAHQATLDEFKLRGNIVTPFKPIKVIGEKNLEKIVLSHMKTNEEIVLDIDYLLVFYGIETNKSSMESWKIEHNNDGIFVKSNMQTNIKGIYASGNGVTYEGKLNMIVTGMGEVGTAIGEISKELYPNRNINTIYSSILVKD